MVFVRLVAVFFIGILHCSMFLSAFGGAPKALVVGASTGIGREVAKELAAHGYEIGLCSRKTDLLEALQQELPTRSWVRYLDLMQTETIHETLQQLVVDMGGMDLIVVNSGIWPEAAVGIMPENKYIPFSPLQETIQVNVLGCTAAFNFATNYFLQQGAGHIVGISSLDAVHGTAVGPAYSASKAFMGTFLEGMRSKFAQAGITTIAVTEIRPGCIQTKDATMDENLTYWVVPACVAARDIYASIVAKDKVAYVPRRWALIALALRLTPDWLYNWMGGF
ncbi:SDR family NAD(P)-dependent oxidoreductase [bacterium]|nr:SDR family NAD(P)-dependent oxidoreductase [bacterium]